MDELESPIRIRAHSLLCLQGYRGLGYSTEFAAAMDHVAEYLRENPAALVKVVAEADVLCEHCPNMVGGRCTVDDDKSRADGPDGSTLMDRRVLGRLGISEGSVQDWASILDIVGRSVNAEAMDELCGDCQWRPYGYCAEALDELHRRVLAGEA